MVAASMTTPRLEQPLSPEKCCKYEDLAQSVVQKTIDQYADYIGTRVSDRRVDPKKWSLLKTRKNLKIYKTREGNEPGVLVGSPGIKRHRYNAEQWDPLSSLLCVGSFVGSVEDAMYGTITPTELSMVTRSMLIHDEFIQHRVLQDIRLPTMDEPFRYVGLKWALRSSQVSGIVRPRDLVYIEATGFRDMEHRGTSERVGYTVCHSVDPLELEPARTDRAIRARWSMCSIYRQKPCGIVDVYITVTSDPSGNLAPRLAIKSAATSLIAAADVMECSLNKKLAWAYQSGAFPIAKKSISPSGSCQDCARPGSTFHPLGTCGICKSTACSRCLTTRKLALGVRVDEIQHRAIHVCASCVWRASRKVDAVQVAAEEYVVDRRYRELQTNFGLECNGLV